MLCLHPGELFSQLLDTFGRPKRRFYEAMMILAEGWDGCIKHNCIDTIRTHTTSTAISATKSCKQHTVQRQYDWLTDQDAVPYTQAEDPAEKAELEHILSKERNWVHMHTG